MNLGKKLQLLASSYLKIDNQMNRPISREDMAVTDVSEFITEIDLSKLEVLKWAPVWMTRAERLLMFSMTFCLRPQRYLEIGTLQGGSALVVASAMDALNSDGKIICVDPDPKVEPEHWAQMEHRATMLKGFSPQVLPEAVALAGGKFDMVLIDGDHTHAGVVRDVDGVLPHTLDGAYLFFHDSFFADVKEGIEECLQNHADELIDFGTMTREISIVPDDPNQTHWGGIRMVQVRRKN